MFNKRRHLALRFGARWAGDGADTERLHTLVQRITRCRGVDAAIIAVPVDSVVAQAHELLRGGGQMMLFSHTRRGATIPLDVSKICVDEKDLIGSYSADFLLQKEVARLVFSRRLDVRGLITSRFRLKDTAAAVDLASRPTPDSLKVMVLPGS